MGVASISQPFLAGIDAYLAFGWRSPFPLPAGKKWPPPSGLTGYKGTDPTDAQLENWRITRPNGNIALRLPENVIGFDVDNYDTANGTHKTGFEQISNLEDKYGALPRTYRSTSREDGVSGIYLYRIPEGMSWPSQLADSIEIIRRGHRYAVCWPSIHPETGKLYRWVDWNNEPIDSVPAVGEIPKLPDRWIAYLSSLPKVIDSAGDEAETSTPADTAAWKAAFLPGPGRMRSVSGLPGVQEDAQEAPEAMCRAMRGVLTKARSRIVDGDGSRYETALRASDALVLLAGEGHLGGAQALARLGATYKAAVAAEVGRDRSEWSRMLNEAIRKAARLSAVDDEGEFEQQRHAPGKCPNRPRKPFIRTTVAGSSAPLIVGHVEAGRRESHKPSNNVIGEITPDELMNLEFSSIAELITDDYLARRMVALNLGTILFRPDVMQWMVWNGDRWKVDPFLYEIMIVAKETPKAIIEEIRAGFEEKIGSEDDWDPDDVGMSDNPLTVDGKSKKLKTKPRPRKGSTPSEECEKLVNAVRRALNVAKIKSVVDMARTEPEIAVESTRLDAQEMLFNLREGTLDLRSVDEHGNVTFREHRSEDLITKVCETKFDPTAEDARWQEFLDMVTGGDVEMQEFLQRAAFASITGSTADKCFINLFDGNVGNTGKTAFLEVIRNVIGSEYCGVANADSFMAKRPGSAGIRSDIATMEGKRMVISSEIPQGVRLDTELMKKLTAGSGSFLFERKYANPWEGEIGFTIWLDGNGTPKANTEDAPLFARWRLVPFRHVIPEGKRVNGWSDLVCGKSAPVAPLSKGGQAYDPGSAEFKKSMRRSERFKSAVLNWILAGREAWFQQGIGTCKRVIEATADVKNNMDPYIDCWSDLAVEFTKDENDIVDKAVFYRQITQWWEENRPGERHLSQPMIASILKSKGCTIDENQRHYPGFESRIRAFHGIKQTQRREISVKVRKEK